VIYIKINRNSLKKRGLTPGNVGDRKVCVVDNYYNYVFS
jgi:hypothetical protein